MPKFVTGAETQFTQQTFPVFGFSEIEMPGAYLEVETGRLFRIQPTALQPGHSPLISITCNQTWKYVKLSDDPNIPISKARVFAADGDLQVCF